MLVSRHSDARSRASCNLILVPLDFSPVSRRNFIIFAKLFKPILLAPSPVALSCSCPVGRGLRFWRMFSLRIYSAILCGPVLRRLLCLGTLVSIGLADRLDIWGSSIGSDNDCCANRHAAHSSCCCPGCCPRNHLGTFLGSLRHFVPNFLQRHGRQERRPVAICIHH